VSIQRRTADITTMPRGRPKLALTDEERKERVRQQDRARQKKRYHL